MYSEIDTIVVNVLGKNLDVKVIHDEDAQSPRDWDNLGTMACSHRSYTLGDIQLKQGDCSESHYDDLALHAYNEFIREGYDDKYFDSYSGDLNHLGLKRAQKWVEKNLICLPLFLIDHSGLSISTTPFSCGWDSGRVGYVFCTKDKARQELGVKRLTQAHIEQIKTRLKAEVSVYDDYLSGSTYSYYSDTLGISCGGFFGYNHEKSGLIEHATSDCLWHVKRLLKNHFDKLKAQIKHRVPLYQRASLAI
jgi:hypothetical protein